MSERLAKILIPTRAQAVVSLVLAAIIVLVNNLSDAVKLTGWDSVSVNAFVDQYHVSSSGVLSTHVASTAALVTFWATVGMIAYLICWSAYNLMIEARNEVTLKTQYTNRGHWRGPYETIGLKAVSAVLLIISIAILKNGLALWLSLAAPMFIDPTMSSVAIGIGAILGMAAQFYLVLAMVIMTFTPWYRKEAFTR